MDNSLFYMFFFSSDIWCFSGSGHRWCKACQKKAPQKRQKEIQIEEKSQEEKHQCVEIPKPRDPRDCVDCGVCSNHVDPAVVLRL